MYDTYLLTYRNMTSKLVVVTTTIRLPVDCNSTALRPFYVTAMLFWAAALRLAGYVAVTFVTFDKQSNEVQIRRVTSTT